MTAAGTRGMRTVEEHRAVVLAALGRTPDLVRRIEDAAGMTLRMPALARLAVPAFDNSAMDGYAVRRVDVVGAAPATPVALRVVADLPAGSALNPPLARGEAARIMTGAPVPSDADAIVPVEDTAEGLEGRVAVTVLRAPVPAAYIRRRGADVDAGAEVVPAGRDLGPFEVAALAASGVTEVVVAAAPRVAVISTGAELDAAGAPGSRGRIPDSNGPLLAALARQAGAEVVFATRSDDRESAFRAALASAAAAEADAIVTSGGISAGAFEVVRNVLGGGGDAFVRVAMQPGGPQGFLVLPGGRPLFALPGNPVSAAVSFEVFVRPALRRMRGDAALHRPVLRLPAAEGWTSPTGRRQYLPAVVDRSDPGRWTVRPAGAGGSGSHLTATLARADGFAVVSEAKERVAPGDMVDVMLVR